MNTLALACDVPALDTSAPVTYNGSPTRIGTIHAINTARPGKPDRVQYYGKNATGTATGASWDDPLNAVADVLCWHLGRSAKPKEVMYGSHLPEMAPAYCECSFVMIMRDPQDQPYCSECKLLVEEPPINPKPAYWQGPALAGTNDCWDDE